MFNYQLFWITLSLFLLSFPFGFAQDRDEVVKRGIQYLDDVKNLEEAGSSAQGRRFDRLAQDFWRQMARDGLAEPVRETFAGDRVMGVHGYNAFRIGNMEIWLQKQEGITRRSLDIIVWRIEHDANGDVVYKGIGMDHHSVHPNSPRATRLHRNHWNEKVATAELWERRLQAQGFNVEIEMDPDNSFYWRDAAADYADEIDEYSRIRAERAARRTTNMMADGIFAGLALKAFGGSLVAANSASTGTELLELLKRFYRSPIFWRTRQLLHNEQYDLAERFWRAQCTESETMNELIWELRRVVTEASSILSIRTYTEFPDAMMYLYTKLEEHARTVNSAGDAPAVAAPLIHRIAFSDLPEDARLLLRIVNDPGFDILAGDSIHLTTRLITLLNGRWIPVTGAPVKFTWYTAHEDRIVNHEMTTNTLGEVSWGVKTPFIPTRGIFDIQVTGHSCEEDLSVNIYDYKVVKEDPGTFPSIAQARDDHPLKLDFLLKRRFWRRDSTYEYRRPQDYQDDFEHIMVWGRRNFVKLGQSAEAFEDYLSLQPSDSTGAFSIYMKALSPGEYEVRLEPAGNKYRDWPFDLNAFSVVFKDHPVNYSLYWPENMAAFKQGDDVHYPMVVKGELLDFPIDIVARYDINDEPVYGARPAMEVSPRGGVRLAYHTFLKTNEEGEAVTGNRRPVLYRVFEDEAALRITANGANNTLHAYAYSEPSDDPVIDVQLTNIEWHRDSGLVVNFTGTIILVPEMDFNSRYDLNITLPGYAEIKIDPPYFVSEPDFVPSMAHVRLSYVNAAVRPDNQGKFECEVTAGTLTTIPISFNIRDTESGVLIGIDKTLRFDP